MPDHKDFKLFTNNEVICVTNEIVLFSFFCRAVLRLFFTLQNIDYLYLSRFPHVSKDSKKQQELATFFFCQALTHFTNTSSYNPMK